MNTTQADTEGQADPRDSFLQDSYQWILVVMEILVVAAIPGNVLTIVAFIKYPSLRVPTNYLVCNLSVADLLVLATSQFFMWLNYTRAGIIKAAQHRYLCLVMLSTIILSLLTSVVNMVLLSCERFMAVAFSYQYLSLVTEHLVLRVIAVVWMLVIFVVVLPLMGLDTWIPGHECFIKLVYPHSFVAFLLLLMMALFLLTAVINIIVGAIAFNKKARPPQPSTANTNSDHRKNPAQSSAADFKITKMFITVIGIFFISWTPYLATSMLIIKPPSSWLQNGPPQWFPFFHEYSKCLLFLNPICNPLVYAHRNVKFRIAFRRLLGLKTATVNPFETH